MTSELITPDGKTMESEAAHGTVRPCASLDALTDLLGNPSLSPIPKG
jgi:hypothetical protein